MLTIQFLIAPDMFMPKYTTEVTKDQTVCDLFNFQPAIKVILCEVRKLLILYLKMSDTSKHTGGLQCLSNISSWLLLPIFKERINGLGMI